MNVSEQESRKISVIGIIFSLAVTAGFAWAAYQWLNRNNQELSKSTLEANEQKTFLNMQMISRSQKKYIEKDWDGDGQKTFALYYVHLWQSVGKDGKPVSVNMIPRQLGFASEIARTVDGYYFYDLHDHINLADGTAKPFDYTKEWAVFGLPSMHSETGMLNFLADQSGNVYVNPAKYVPYQYPENPQAAGWTKIDNLEELKAFQAKIVYKRDN